MNNNRCLYCNEIIPEERTICPLCENEQMKMSMILQSFNATKEEVNKAYNFMEGNDDT
jgi:hypothetical protein